MTTFIKKQANSEAFLITLGNTERPAEEIISLFRKNIPALAGMHLTALSSSRTGQVQIAVEAPPGQLNSAELQQTINTLGECMFQVDSIETL